MATFEETMRKQDRGAGREPGPLATPGVGTGRRWQALAWWALFLVSLLFGAYALYLGILEALVQLGLAPAAPERAVPGAFILHALAGGVALIVGPLQFRPTLRAKRRALHRALGRAYVVCVWIASVTGLWSALFFDRGVPARAIFVLVAILWFGATTMAYLRARDRRFKAHRQWMIRTFALSLFFVTFPLWTEALAATPLPGDVGYPLGLFLAASINLAIAERWIRAGRRS